MNSIIIKRTLLSFLLLFFTYLSKGQNNTVDHLDTLVSNFTDSLRSEKIDTICIYQNYCVGCAYIFTKENQCNFSNIYIPTFILWIDNGKTYMTKKDNCFDYSINEINADSLWYRFKLYKNIIQKEMVKQFEYFTFENGKKKLMTIMIDHSSHKNFRIIYGKNNITKSFNSFDIQRTEESESEGIQNINYQHNINLKSKLIVNDLDKLVSVYESDNSIMKTRRK